MPQNLERSDMQGLLVSAFGHLPCAAYRLLRIEDPPAARAWLGSLTGRVTTAERKDDQRSLNIAITASGLVRLGLRADALDSFPVAFQEGMASPRRSRVLGDSGENNPERWAWGGLGTSVDVMLLIYAVDEAELARQQQALAVGPASGLREITTLMAGRQPDSREHFGFMDGIGQPVVEGSNRELRQKQRTGHATVLPAGEFVLGYDNAYGSKPLMPTVAASDDPRNELRGETGKDRRAFGRNGSYLVFRQLQQDVPGFWDYVTKAAHQLWPSEPEAEAATRLASKFVGRWPSGAPLVTHPDRDPFPGDLQTDAENDFAYAEADRYGLKCPLGAHIRRSNPRDSGGEDPAAARASANRHRLLRRGRSYGQRIANRMQEDRVERGLHFICLNTDLERQFEFVQQTWINNPVFGALYSETDPIVGDQQSCGRTFTIPASPLRRRVRDLPQFVRVHGGAYFFLPGIRSLRFLTRT